MSLRGRCPVERQRAFAEQFLPTAEHRCIFWLLYTWKKESFNSNQMPENRLSGTSSLVFTSNVSGRWMDPWGANTGSSNEAERTVPFGVCLWAKASCGYTPTRTNGPCYHRPGNQREQTQVGVNQSSALRLRSSLISPPSPWHIYFPEGWYWLQSPRLADSGVLGSVRDPHVCWGG